MNKLIKQFFETKQMTIEKENGYGIINGYETNLIFNQYNSASPVLLHISTFIPVENKQVISDTIKNMNVKFLNFNFTPYGLLVGLNDLTIKKLVNRLDDILNSIYAILNDFGAKPAECCPICGEVFNENKKICNIDGLKITIDNSCVEKINQEINNANDEFDKLPNNYIKGFIGALGGALVGAIVSVILYYLGFISAISAFVAIILGVKFYQKMGGKPNKVMILITTITTVVVLILATFGIYYFSASSLAIENGFTSTGFKAFKDMMTVSNFKSGFISDMIMTVLFTIIGIIYQVIDLSKSIKRVDKIN